MRLDSAFDEFFAAIALGSLPEGRIKSAYDRLFNYLTSNLPSGSRVFAQGSIPNQTAVKPPDRFGEYDLDVVAVHVAPGVTAESALDDLEKLLALDSDYARRIEHKAPCVRLRYADDDEGKFRIDITPARQLETGVLEVPRRGDGWHESNPEGFTRWCLSQGEQFSRTIRYLKRWRDVSHGQRRGIKSIVLQVLTAQYHLPSGADAECVVRAFQGIDQYLSASPNRAPEVCNPALPNENLTARWSNDQYREFLQHLDAARRLAEAALNAQDETKSYSLWHELFGKDFPLAPRRSTPPLPVVPPVPPPPDYGSHPQRAPRRERYG
jgi:hypothetical protein